MFCSDKAKENELVFRFCTDSPRYDQEVASIGKYLKSILSKNGRDGGGGNGGGGGTTATTLEITINWEYSQAPVS